MQPLVLQTERLRLFAHTPEQLRALLEGTEPYERRFSIRLADGVREFLVSDDVSPDWLARLKTATEPDPWMYGFAVQHLDDGTLIGMGGFKGPPDADGVVEIAYGIVAAYQGRGYATEVARALMGYATESGRAITIRAHTLPEANASTRVLEKCGFRRVGEVTDPEDGPVWRWEYPSPEDGLSMTNA
jgi:[ribosomal protein S5]-alanine N-acetyltransferase